MARSYLLSCLLTCFLTGIVSHEAIINGLPVYNNLAPYQVIVQVHSLWWEDCGGGIISQNSILTAAHCVFKGPHIHKRISVVAGTNDLARTESPAVTREVTKVYVPKEYTPGILTHGDISVLQLKDPLGMSERTNNMKALQLPTYPDSKNYVGTTALIAGFGIESLDALSNLYELPRKDSRLRFTAAYIINSTKCRQSHPEKNIHDRLICTECMEYNNLVSRVCFGDAGGPLVIRGTRLAIGVLSQIPSDCKSGRPAIYTSFVHYKDFVLRATLRGEDESTMNVYHL